MTLRFGGLYKASELAVDWAYSPDEFCVPKLLSSEHATSRRRSFAWGDVTRGELKNFDGFLDKHPEIDEQLRKNPGLINDPKYVNDHPELKEFLENHPGVREELKEHPKYFMHREKQFDRRERAGRRRK